MNIDGRMLYSFILIAVRIILIIVWSKLAMVFAGYVERQISGAWNGSGHGGC